ncbi:MAG: hypothetical protein NTZ46_02175 [Verrucomicrobia bacterium]|nr:hypothetical protein [Verrucomicrobiota bacterium]
MGSFDSSHKKGAHATSGRGVFSWDEGLKLGIEAFDFKIGSFRGLVIASFLQIFSMFFLENLWMAGFDSVQKTENLELRNSRKGKSGSQETRKMKTSCFLFHLFSCLPEFLGILSFIAPAPPFGYTLFSYVHTGDLYPRPLARS